MPVPARLQALLADAAPETRDAVIAHVASLDERIADLEAGGLAVEVLRRQAAQLDRVEALLHPRWGARLAEAALERVRASSTGELVVLVSTLGAAMGWSGWSEAVRAAWAAGAASLGTP